jgi:hypothetical protein
MGDKGNPDRPTVRPDKNLKDKEVKDKEKREKREKDKIVRHTNIESPSLRHMAVGVHRRADSTNPASDCMRHRVRRSWREWEKIGASVQTLQWIRQGVLIPFKNNRPPPLFLLRIFHTCKPRLDAEKTNWKRHVNMTFPAVSICPCSSGSSCKQFTYEYGVYSIA